MKSMERLESEAVRRELIKLLDLQIEALQSRAFGVASDGELIEYEDRLQSVRQIRQNLAYSVRS
jgi:hypothetical protein